MHAYLQTRQDWCEMEPHAVAEVYAPFPGPAMEDYQDMYARSISHPDQFWKEQAEKYLNWFHPFDRVSQGSFESGDIAWYLGGKLNACYCCIDQHLPARANQPALIWEGDEPGHTVSITYSSLLARVCRIANVMKAMGIRKGDMVTIYMPMIPELAMLMLACARIGAPHSVVFAGFSSESLRSRILDCSSQWVFTTDEGRRGGKTLHLKQIVDAAVLGLECVKNVFVFRRTNADVPMTASRDLWMDDLLPAQRPYCPAEVMDSEDILFILYTSGSTGKPKGVAHSTAGYLTYAAVTCKHTFDLREGDVYACVADCGWITGHSYIVYGPLVNGTTSMMFESTPLYPNHLRYWDLVQRHRVTQFYTAPTAIRSLMRYDVDDIGNYDLSTLRILGSVGEPINPEAWWWYYTHVGRGRCTIVDTWWQTETGGHMCTPLPGITPMKPGSCTFPCYGVQLAVLDSEGKELEGNDVEGVLCVKRSWPGITRTVWGDHERYLTVYMRPYPGFYFTGDGCRRDKDGYIWITGRVDDVLNTSGHRIGTAEVESALVGHLSVSEAAVIGFPHAIKGEGICAYVILKQGVSETSELEHDLKLAVRTAIGAFATPDVVVVCPGLPKTRSGKIMRRILRKLAAGEANSLGDTSTLADPGIVDILVQKLMTKL